MRIAQSVRLGAWLLIGFNLLMALGCVWIFMRMSPAIEVIIKRNTRSLEACGDMLVSLALEGQGPDHESDLRKTFISALNRARNNITEPGEPSTLDSIATHYEAALKGDASARRKTVSAITQLGEINRNAMVSADLRAKQFGNAGAWGVVFMAVLIFLVELIFKKTLFKKLVEPLQEVNAVMTAHQHGDRMRRCSGPDLPSDIRNLYDGINTLLDQKG
jgi:hypothetical protein